MELSTEETDRLFTIAAQGEHPARDRALLGAALYWGFTPTELSRLEIAHVMSVQGEWREQFLLPAGFAFNNLARSAWLLDARFIACLDHWLLERRSRRWGLADDQRHQSLDGRSPLFLNNQGKPFAMTPRTPGSRDLLPSGMHRQLRDLLNRAGCPQHSPQVFRDTYIVRLWLHGLSRQQIATLTGIRKTETITRKIRHLLPEPRAVFERFMPAPGPVEQGATPPRDSAS